MLDTKKALKIPGFLAAAGLFAGLAWAFLIEMVLDRSIRRSVDIEKKLRLPLFLSIPDLSEKRLRWPVHYTIFKRRGEATPKTNGNVIALSEAINKSQIEESLATNDTQALHLFHETLRDRLIGFFESRDLTHKPKLVALTSVGIGSGVTTTAAGLSCALSETGDGNVLLVDLTPGQGSAQQFYRGKPICSIDQILSTRDNAHVQENLYVVSDNPKGDHLNRILLQRFKHMVPKLKASDFDYIIFDMPPISQISITPRLAGLMDIVLLVIESEKTNEEIVQKATSLLAESKVHIGAVLNREKFHYSSKLHKEYQGQV